MNPILLTTQQVSKILGVSVGTLAVWRTTKRYNLPYVKSGRLVRYREEDVQALYPVSTSWTDSASLLR
ncbi:MAG: helix-turn-helix domain-containing protein [Alphaproteobacteria bacterium]|jgi:excisionase family DNA binding protein|nr:helix-turn-helix domain-containing protein [Alphaproteobacteria bacterium]